MENRINLELKNLLRSYISQELLPGVYGEDLDGLTEAEAKFFVRCAEANRWRGPKRYVDYLMATDRDIAPATPKQLRRIVKLGKEGFLNPLSTGSLLKITHLSANRLIWRGEMNRREARYAASF